LLLFRGKEDLIVSKAPWIISLREIALRVTVSFQRIALVHRREECSFFSIPGFDEQISGRLSSEDLVLTTLIY